MVFLNKLLTQKKKSPLGPRQYDTRAQRANSPSLPPPVGAHTPSRRTNPGIVHCWEKLLAAWEPASVMEAGQLLAAGTLFKDAREAGLEAPTAGAEAVEPDGTAEGAAEWATAEPEEDDEYMCSTWTGTASRPSRARRWSRAAASRVARSGRGSVSIAVCGAWC